MEGLINDSKANCRIRRNNGDTSAVALSSANAAMDNLKND